MSVSLPVTRNSEDGDEISGLDEPLPSDLSNSVQLETRSKGQTGLVLLPTWTPECLTDSESD